MQGQFNVLRFIEQEFAKDLETDAVKAHRASYSKAMRMVETQAKQAFQLEDEKPELRDAYGRNRFGQGCLLARRLVERGVPFVEVSLSGVDRNQTFGWDTHQGNFDSVQKLSECSTMLKQLILPDETAIFFDNSVSCPQFRRQPGKKH